MATIGTYGFKKDGELKVTLNRHDSQPDILGENIVSFIRSTTLEEMKQIFDNIIMLSKEAKINKRIFDHFEKHVEFNYIISYDDFVGEHDITKNTLYVFACEIDGRLSYYKNGLEYMIDVSDEFGNHNCNYLIDLDDEKFIVQPFDLPEIEYDLFNIPYDWAEHLNELDDIYYDLEDSKIENKDSIIREINELLINGLDMDNAIKAIFNKYKIETD